MVRKIFDMFHGGMGTFQIALALSDEKILIPSEYAIKRGIRKAGELPAEHIPILTVGEFLLFISFSVCRNTAEMLSISNPIQFLIKTKSGIKTMLKI